MIPEGNPKTHSREIAYICEHKAFDLHGQSCAGECAEASSMEPVATPTAGRPTVRCPHQGFYALPLKGEKEMKRER